MGFVEIDEAHADYDKERHEWGIRVHTKGNFRAYVWMRKKDIEWAMSHVKTNKGQLHTYPRSEETCAFFAERLAGRRIYLEGLG